MPEGYISLYRRLEEHWIFKNPTYLKIWIHFLFSASYREHTQLVGSQLVNLERGQFVFGRISCANNLGVSEQVLRTFIQLLIKDKIITIKPTNKFSVITIINYDTYQMCLDENNQQINQQATSSQPAVNQQATTNNKDNNENKGNNKDILNDNLPQNNGSTANAVSPISWSEEKGFINLTETRINAYIDSFQLINVRAELKQIHSWLVSNPKSRPKSDYGRFIHAWLKKNNNAEAIRKIPPRNSEGLPR
jgi:hypothetical protein